jgi:HlyD family secretion protein
MKRFRRILFIVLGLGLFLWTLWFLYQKSVEKPLEFNVEKPRKHELVRKTVANGSIVPRKEVLIKPVVSGIILELYVEAGQQVKKGDQLAKIQIVPDMLSLSQAEQRVRSADINLQNAQMTFERNKPLADRGVISASEMQGYDIGLRNAKQEVDAVLDVPVKEGNSVTERNNFNEGTTIATIADMNDLIFQGKVDESEVGKVKLGMPVVLTVGAVAGAKWDAQLEYIAPKGVEDQGAIQFEIRAAVKLNEGQTLRSGYSANADIVLERKADAMVIPEGIVTFNTKGDSAFVDVKEGEGWKKTYIKTGLSDGLDIEVLEGITMDTEIKGLKKDEAPEETME